MTKPDTPEVMGRAARRRRAARLGLAAILLAGLAPGCRLIDQRTFDPDAGRRPAAAALPALPPPTQAAPGGPTPLVAIPLDPPVDYDAPLHDAIAAALARNRRVFEVRTVVSGLGAADVQDAAAQDALHTADRVARLIAAQGGRTTLSAQSDPAVAGRMVLVFVR